MRSDRSTRRHRPLQAALAATALLAACDLEDPALGTSHHASVVSDHRDSGCSTEVVLGLSLQIADEITCLDPDRMVRFEESDGIVFAGPAVLPYLAPGAHADLRAAVQEQGGELRINSAFRTVAQQYLLRQWFERGRCGITAAAPPGTSNHESGRALDIDNWPDWVATLGSHGWDHTVPGDEVHFDHLASPDQRGFDVLAFQRLWNRNHPDDLIDEDGLYGGMTEARLAGSPAEGFAVGSCLAGPYQGELVAIDAPEVVAPGDRIDIAIRVRNTGTEPWEPGQVLLGTTAPSDRDSALHDPDSWLSPTRPATVAAATPPGEVGVFAFAIVAPDLEDEVVQESFGLVREGGGWFAPMAIEVEILVSSTALEGGCAIGDRTDGAWLVLLALLLAVPRRRVSRSSCRSARTAS